MKIPFFFVSIFLFKALSSPFPVKYLSVKLCLQSLCRTIAKPPQSNIGQDIILTSIAIVIVNPNVAAVIITGRRTKLKRVFLSFVPSSCRT